MTQRMTETGVGAVFVDSPLGPAGIVTADDVIEAIATGADPDTVWEGEITGQPPTWSAVESVPRRSPRKWLPTTRNGGRGRLRCPVAGAFALDVL